MRFLIDENLPYQLAGMAEARGREARWVRNVMPGAEDAIILEHLIRSGEVLVTRDVRFANLVLARMIQQPELAGVVLIRERQLAAVRAAWQRYLERYPEGIRALIVAERHRLRIRRLDP